MEIKRDSWDIYKFPKSELIIDNESSFTSSNVLVAVFVLYCNLAFLFAMLNTFTFSSLFVAGAKCSFAIPLIKP